MHTQQRASTEGRRRQTLTLSAGNGHTVEITIEETNLETAEGENNGTAKQAVLEGPIRQRIEAEARTLSRALIATPAPMRLEDHAKELDPRLEEQVREAFRGELENSAGWRDAFNESWRDGAMEAIAEHLMGQARTQLGSREEGVFEHPGDSDSIEPAREAQTVAICNGKPVPEQSFREIADHIRRKVIYEGLELEEIGIELSDVTDDVPLFDENGLNLDSIDGLEILAGVEREFGVSIASVDEALINEHGSTVERLARMVENPDFMNKHGSTVQGLTHMVKDVSGTHGVGGKATENDPDP